MQGLLLVNKPTGISSYDVIRHLKRQLPKTKPALKIGHAGTLDPLASGLMIILLGRATKQQASFMRLPKTYRADIKLGATSSTDDAEGVLSHQPVTTNKRPNLAAVKQVLSSFLGEVKQVPPQYSAIKVQGRRSYKIARAGGSVALAARPVRVHNLQITRYCYPLLSFKTSVSSGTYIRSLARDIGQALGTGAYLIGLERLAIGRYQLSQAAGLNDLDTQTIPKLLIVTD